MKRVLADGWFQMFTAVAGLSAMIMAFDRFGPQPVMPEPPTAVYTPPPEASPARSAGSTAVPAPASAPAAPRPAATTAAASRAEAASRLSPENYVRATPESRPSGAGSNAAAGGAPAASFPIFKIAPKTPGRWIVSNQDGPDVDSPSIMRVIFSASDGDVVLIRPGMYLEPLMVLRKTLTFRGLGKRPEEVLVTSPDPAAVLRVQFATVKLENLRIEPEKGYSATAAAVYAASGRLTLKNVVARSQGAAIQAAQGQGSDTVVDAASSRLDGAYADVLVRGKARVAVKDVDFGNARQPLVVWRDTSVRIDACRFPKDPRARIYAYEESAVSIDASPTAPPVSSRRVDADANADKARFSSGQASRPGRATGWNKDIFKTGF